MKFAMTVFGVGAGMLAASLWLFLPNWQGIKGAYFSDLASFSSAEGVGSWFVIAVEW
jgi:hypothetical protein